MEQGIHFIYGTAEFSALRWGKKYNCLLSVEARKWFSLQHVGSKVVEVTQARSKVNLPCVLSISDSFIFPWSLTSYRFYSLSKQCYYQGTKCLNTWISREITHPNYSILHIATIVSWSNDFWPNFKLPLSIKIKKKWENSSQKSLLIIHPG